jgi:hypothetical protein
LCDLLRVFPQKKSPRLFLRVRHACIVRFIESCSSPEALGTREAARARVHLGSLKRAAAQGINRRRRSMAASPIAD